MFLNLLLELDQESGNELIRQILMSDAMFNFFIHLHWMKLLFVHNSF